MKRANKPKTPRQIAEPFLANIALLLDNKERILSDGKMAYAKVPVLNGLAYTGRAGFQNPTLGLYLKFWEKYPELGIKEDKEGEKRYLWFISGSPLSGRNCCSWVNRQGKTKTIPVAPFLPVWSNFVEINADLQDNDKLSEAYTLDEVINILKTETL